MVEGNLYLQGIYNYTQVVSNVYNKQVGLNYLYLFEVNKDEAYYSMLKLEWTMNLIGKYVMAGAVLLCILGLGLQVCFCQVATMTIQKPLKKIM